MQQDGKSKTAAYIYLGVMVHNGCLPGDHGAVHRYPCPDTWSMGFGICRFLHSWKDVHEQPQA